MGTAARKICTTLRLLGILVLAATLAACTTTDTLKVSASDAAPSKYAAIVVDANSGRTIYSAGADLQRYPASLAKMMTLYLLFEALDSGQMSKETQIRFSSNASRQSPSKLGLKSGQTIDVDTAIRAMVVKSANDVAVAVAEQIAGSEAQFAGLMTAKARSLGMAHTTFRNASGLPDPGQRTTARDMAILAIALQKRFPHHYHYFKLRQFAYAGRQIRGHNKALDLIPGADGLKTGYIRASGFNLATSVSRSGRRIVAVVMGGNTAKSRDAHMAALVQKFLPRASAGR